MRRLVLFVLIIIGAAAGAAVGYAVAAMEASLSTSFVDPRPSNKQGFDRTVDEFASVVRLK